VDTRARLLPAERAISGDRYLFIRDAFLQRREYRIRDGMVEDDPFVDDEFGDFEDEYEAEYQDEFDEVDAEAL
jgi:phospholipid-binding lipoprotein MlaA